MLTDVTLEQERLLALLERGIADEAVEGEDRALIERLKPALLERSSIEKPRLSGDFVRGAFAELIRASYLTNLDGIAVLENRAKKAVHIDSLSAGGLLIALGLAAAGVGRLLTTDTERVSEHDTSALGYRRDQVGNTRLKAINELLRERPGDTAVQNFDSLTPAKRRHELRVLIAQNAMPQRSYRELLKTKTPHIGVFFGTEWVAVSPRILSNPCLGCLDRHRADADPAWPMIASQLIGRIDYLEDARSSLFAAAMVVGEILRAIDTPNEGADFVGHRLNVASGRVEPWSWEAHPSCECAP